MIEPYGDEYFMKQAFFEAEKAMEDGEVPVGAVVVFKNRVISKGFNQTQRLNDVTAHAEMIAITSAFEHIGGKYLNECILYVTLEPCVMCAGALKWAQLSRLVFGAADLKSGFTNINEQILHPKTRVSSHVMAEPCGKILTDFFQKQRALKKLN